MFNLPERLENSIRQWCDANGISDIEGYISECVEKQFNIDRYGDLNVILGITPQKSDESQRQEKKQRKTTRTKKPDKGKEEPDDNCEKNGTVFAENEVKDKQPTVEKPQKTETSQGESSGTRKKRVLKSK